MNHIKYELKIIIAEVMMSLILYFIGVVSIFINNTCLRYFNLY